LAQAQALGQQAQPLAQAGPPVLVLVLVLVLVQVQEVRQWLGAAERVGLGASSLPLGLQGRLWAQPIPLVQVAHSAARLLAAAMAAVSTPVWAVRLEARAWEAWPLRQAVVVPVWAAV
jgi:hypothetical protein